jgi:hypothetical protein
MIKNIQVGDIIEVEVEEPNHLVKELKQIPKEEPTPKKEEATEEKETKNYFNKLKLIKCTTEKKRDLTYISWADAWSKLKEQYSDANYVIHENEKGMPYFVDSCGAFAKVTVTVKNIPHTVHLPVMDYNNAPMKIEQQSMERMNKFKGVKETIIVEALNSFAINKTIQRALTKAIAMHGLGLYVYQGEDLPPDE